MSELSSCYFCGTALDAPVRRYPLTPDDIEVDTGRTVALCPTCRRKLGKVLTAVTAEMTSTDSDSTPDAEGADEGADSDPTTPSVTPDEGERASGDVTAEDSPTSEEGDVADGSDDPGAATGDADADVGTNADVGTDADTESLAGTDSTESVEWETPGEDADDTQSVESGGSVSESSADSGGAGGGDRPEILSTPAAKKVIRLLQNREFPVEREEFEVVAGNAYEIPMQDCREVVDALVEAGYVEQEGDELVRSDQ